MSHHELKSHLGGTSFSRGHQLSGGAALRDAKEATVDVLIADSAGRIDCFPTTLVPAKRQLVFFLRQATARINAVYFVAAIRLRLAIDDEVRHSFLPLAIVVVGHKLESRTPVMSKSDSRVQLNTEHPRAVGDGLRK